MQSIIHSGWLVKRGNVRRNWKQRWFVFMANGTLEYYADKVSEKAGQSPRAPKRLGKIDLTGALSIGQTIEVSVQPYSIDLVTKNRTWTLSCGTRDNQNLWLTLLSDHVDTYDNRLEVAKEGVLVKQGAKVKNWKSRYFIASAGNVVYFKTRSESLKFRRVAGADERSFIKAVESAKGRIPLDKAKVEVIGEYEKNDNCFSITIPGRVYRISANSESEVGEWIKSIRSQMPEGNVQRIEIEEEEEKKVTADSDSDFENDDAEVPSYVDRRVTMSKIGTPELDNSIEPPGLPREPTGSGTHPP